MREAGAQNRSPWAAPLRQDACCTTSNCSSCRPENARLVAAVSTESRLHRRVASSQSFFFYSLSFTNFLPSKHQLMQRGRDFSALSKACVTLMTAESAYLTCFLFSLQNTGKKPRWLHPAQETKARVKRKKKVAKIISDMMDWDGGPYPLTFLKIASCRSFSLPELTSRLVLREGTHFWTLCPGVFPRNSLRTHTQKTQDVSAAWSKAPYCFAVDILRSSPFILSAAAKQLHEPDRYGSK